MSNKRKFEDISNLLFLILSYRQSSNNKQTSLGMEIGLSQKQYSRIESGNVELKLQVFLQIAHALKINPCDLLEESGLLNAFPPCKQTLKTVQLIEEIKELKRRNDILEKILTNNGNK